MFEGEKWSLTLREERSLREFENNVMKRIFGPSSDEVAGDLRKPTIEELNDSNNIVWLIKSIILEYWCGRVVRMGDRRAINKLW